ncbi:hypothetical protein N7540_000233 [Penicillium herquei]|nr:hypothetical protein N7540_000233 [Penicillium herquei]
MITGHATLWQTFLSRFPIPRVITDWVLGTQNTEETPHLPKVNSQKNARPSSLPDTRSLNEESIVADECDAAVLVGADHPPAQVNLYTNTAPLIGLPVLVSVDGVMVRFGPYMTARRAAVTYCLSVGISPDTLPSSYVKVDKNKARIIARLYDELQPTPHDKLTQASYRALAEETLAQWKIIKATGLRVEYNPTIRGEPDPYSNPRRLILDVKQNNHLFVTATRSAYGNISFELDPLNPLLDEVCDERICGEVPLVNDILRIVHDYFGHTREGLGFRSEGEYNAWRGHLAMYSPLARRAMTMEMWVQNCWINYGPFGESNWDASMEETKFPQQKLALLPVWVSEDLTLMEVVDEQK